ncbi:MULTISPECIES: glycine cleavage system protein GcvH [Streptomyces]|uniref:glycine cleavage system protein GcvH n=1 Tax=Streptomyces TaxID=1883 RepID=UPI0006467019|nr:glycine cleavage system protein GcvH [Streptomyces sp. M10]
MNVPAELKYSEDHVWVAPFTAGRARVGLTDFAQRQLGDIIYLELPQVGQALDTGQSMGQVESVKAASDFYAPVTGRVTAVNEELSQSPEMVNVDPYGDGWLVEIELTDAATADQLLDAEKYRGLVTETES